MQNIKYFALLCGSTMANFSNMEDSYAALVNETIQQGGMRNLGADHRAFLGSIATTLEPLTNYGCWCYFQDDHGKGKSHPQNEVDAICKVLHDGYECAVMDGLAEGEPCEPWTVEYESINSLGRFDNSLQVACEASNAGNNCAIRACVIEGNFILQVFATFLSGYTFDITLHHFGLEGNEPWNPDEHCLVTKGEVSEIDCCGYYPERFPYRINEGRRGCCGSFTYNTKKLQCCGDDELKGKAANC